jgi:hypothetical protein
MTQPRVVDLDGSISSQSQNALAEEYRMTRKRRPQRHAIAPYAQHREVPEMNPQLAATILEIVDTQLRDGTPPQTRQTFDRLVAEGYTPEGARQLLAHVVVREIFTVMARGEHYDQARFIAALQQLPSLPDATNEGEY